MFVAEVTPSELPRHSAHGQIHGAEWPPVQRTVGLSAIGRARQHAPVLLEVGLAQRHGGSKAADTRADDTNAKHSDDRPLPQALLYAHWPSSEHGFAAVAIA
jgi:hypothetical protein